MLGGMPPLRERYAPKLARLGDRIRRAPQRVEVEKSQYRQQKMQTVVSIGATVLGALFGRKLGSVGNFGCAAIRPRKADLAVERVALVWTPWRVGQDGIAEPVYQPLGDWQGGW
jgi:hypothetical protein